MILDSSVLISGERRGETVRQILRRIQITQGDGSCALSVVTVVELTHGIFRAKSDADRNRRRLFCDELRRDLFIQPLTIEIAELAGRIEGEQAALGVSIAFEDLLIGATALHLGFGVATYNLRHFQKIPGLSLVQI